MSPPEWLILTLSTVVTALWAFSAAASLIYLRNGFHTTMWKAIGASVLLGPMLLVAGETRERFAGSLKPRRASS